MVMQRDLLLDQISRIVKTNQESNLECIWEGGELAFL